MEKTLVFLKIFSFSFPGSFPGCVANCLEQPYLLYSSTPHCPPLFTGDGSRMGQMQREEGKGREMKKSQQMITNHWVPADRRGGKSGEGSERGV